MPAIYVKNLLPNTNSARFRMFNQTSNIFVFSVIPLRSNFSITDKNIALMYV